MILSFLICILGDIKITVRFLKQCIGRVICIGSFSLYNVKNDDLYNDKLIGYLK